MSNDGFEQYHFDLFQSVLFPTGKLLGGSSQLNAMMYIRGEFKRRKCIHMWLYWLIFRENQVTNLKCL